MSKPTKTPMVLPDLSKAPLREIGNIIAHYWPQPYFGAAPYIEAMQASDHTGKYGLDDAACLTMYFLSNARTWRGPVARAVKTELRRRLDE